MNDSDSNGPSLRAYVETRLELLASAMTAAEIRNTKSLDVAFSAQQTAMTTAFIASEKAVESALEAAKEAVQAALAAADRAVSKTEVSTDKRFESLAQLIEQRFKSTAEKNDSTNQRIDGLDARSNVTQGEKSGSAGLWVTMVAVVSIVINAVGMVMHFIK